MCVRKIIASWMVLMVLKVTMIRDYQRSHWNSFIFISDN